MQCVNGIPCLFGSTATNKQQFNGTNVGMSFRCSLLSNQQLQAGALRFSVHTFHSINDAFAFFVHSNRYWMAGLRDNLASTLLLLVLVE